MSKSSDYLWDKSGPPDPEVERLEKLLAPMRHQPPRRRGPLLLAALAIAAAFLLFLLLPRPGWDVVRMTGRPTIAGRALTSTGKLPVGKWLETDDLSSAQLKVAEIGTMIVRPRTRVQLLETKRDRHRVVLDRGTIEVFVSAPPRVFVVDTAEISAVDLGCAYTMSIDDVSREITVHVTSGQVSLELGGRSTVVRHRMSAVTRNRVVGTPFSDRSTPELRAALHKFDFEGGSALEVVNASTPPDAPTLLLLLERVPPEVRPAIYSRLEELSPPPPNVKKEDVLQLAPPSVSAWQHDIEAKW